MTNKHSAKSLSGNSSGKGVGGGELRWTLGGTRGQYRNTAREKEATPEIPCRKSTNYRYYIYDRSFSLGCIHLACLSTTRVETTNALLNSKAWRKKLSLLRPVQKSGNLKL